ncbi:MAG: formylglycine-generating enzyme family protein [Pseudomonadota bacterium]|nr:formylglycine-generating enzyme family protein [Pseudomonadota bacterium]
MHRYHIEAEMVEIRAGSFQMGDLQGTGDADEKPVRKSGVSKAVRHRQAVTFAEYERMLYAHRGDTTSAWFWSDDVSQAWIYANVFNRGMRQN